jgi:hypothetical protein
MPSAGRNKLLNDRKAQLLQKIIEQKRQIKDYRQNNLMEFFTKPKDEMGIPANPLQAELLEAWENPRFKVFTYTGANRIGKTTILAIVAFSVMFGRWLWNDKRIWFSHTNPRKVRLVGQDWEKHVKAVLSPELKKWWPKNRKIKGGKPKKNNNGVDYFWEDEKTGSTLEIMSNLQDSDLHEGWQGDLVCYDEPPKRDVRVANARGLIDRLGRELFTMTLLKEAWVDREVIKAVDEDGKPDRTVFSVDGPIEVNIGFGITQEGVDQFAKTLTEDEKSARLAGKPSYLSGLVYPTFKRKVHLIERFEVPSNWIVDIGIDFHPRKQQAILFIATDERQERYVINEIWDYGDGDVIADAILKRISRNNYRVGRVIIDPLSKGDDQNDENTTFRKIQKKLWRHEIPLQVATKDISSGIVTVKDHLLGPNNKPSLFIFDDCVRVLYEIEGYMWDKETQKPLKENDDMMENLYRLLLLDTQYVDPEDEDWEEEDYQDEDVNAVTGY